MVFGAVARVAIGTPESVHNDVFTQASGIQLMGTTTQPDTRTWMCDRCGAAMIELHCKLRCDNCGFMRDCSDP